MLDIGDRYNQALFGVSTSAVKKSSSKHKVFKRENKNRYENKKINYCICMKFLKRVEFVIILFRS